VKGDGSNPVSIILFFFTFKFTIVFFNFVVGRLDQPNYIFFVSIGLGFIIMVRVQHYG